MAKKKFKVEVEWKLLEDIARYYEFPSAVFLGKEMPQGTRNDFCLRRIVKIQKEIKEFAKHIEEVI